MTAFYGIFPVSALIGVEVYNTLIFWSLKGSQRLPEGCQRAARRA